MERIAAHAITFEGKTYRMSVLELTDDSEVSIYPLTEEIYSTRFLPGHISVTVSPEGKLEIRQLTSP